MFPDNHRRSAWFPPAKDSSVILLGHVVCSA